MPAAIWSPEAGLDLEQVAFHIAVHDGRPATADRIVREVHKLCDLIATQPEMGEAPPKLGPGLRVFSYKRWMIVYRAVENSVEVLRFVDGARDYNQLF